MRKYGRAAAIVAGLALAAVVADALVRVPADVAEVTAVADSLRSRADEVAVPARASVAKVKRRRAELPPVTDSAAAIAVRDTLIDTLVVAAERLDTALSIEKQRGDTLQNLVRRLDRPWWKPEIGGGPFLGVCTSGKPCAGVGVSLTWRF